MEKAVERPWKCENFVVVKRHYRVVGREKAEIKDRDSENEKGKKFAVFFGLACSGEKHNFSH